MKKKILALDCDDVLAKFTEQSLSLLNEFNNSNFQESDIDQWDFFKKFLPEDKLDDFFEFLADREIIKNLNPFEEALNHFDELRKYFRIYIVTSPMSSYSNWIPHRNEWLKKHFDIPASKVIHTSAKYRVHADVFVDDRTSSVEKWIKQWGNEGNGILWKKQGNLSHGSKVIINYTNDWKDVLKYG